MAVAKSAYGMVGSGWGFAERRAPAATHCINLDAAMFSCSGMRRHADSLCIVDV